ncbi:MAG TPA: class I SAM-dependent methyltransferase [Spirochaetota bacterium]|nr:class I SAM-dependent methyltransferase [Spirochaetota bacterium]HRZ25911.1 class I SAM-dependent methyltransferase [Spirochaetota bacterium]
MEETSCILCSGGKARPLFAKASRQGDVFQLNRCRVCGLEFISPRPTRDEIGAYYRADYFSRRDDRGYDDYFSERVRAEVERVFVLNLRDLGFFEFEKSLDGEKNALDIGCAAGYFVSYLDARGWDSRGIDISRECVDAAKTRGLSVDCGDYLSQSYPKKFKLITLWASIEHLHDPHLFLEKAWKDLDDGGTLFISTCRTGGMNFMRLYGRDWRFYNFPEHLYFFSRRTMKKILERAGFRMAAYRTYGSGFGKPGTPARRAADFMAKRMYMGDMMLVGARKAR